VFGVRLPGVLVSELLRAAMQAAYSKKTQTTQAALW
jgi:hypothetical protein